MHCRVHNTWLFTSAEFCGLRADADSCVHKTRSLDYRTYGTQCGALAVKRFDRLRGISDYPRVLDTRAWLYALCHTLRGIGDDDRADSPDGSGSQ